MKISEININPIKPQNGLIGFVSILVDDNLYLSSIAIYRRVDGSYRLLYPTKTIGERPINIFHPINHQTSKTIEQAVFNKCVNVFEKGYKNDRYDKTNDFSE